MGAATLYLETGLNSNDPNRELSHYNIYTTAFLQLTLQTFFFHSMNFFTARRELVHSGMINFHAEFMLF